MRVLHITNNYPTSKNKVFGIFVKEQIESLNRVGQENDVFFINGRENGKLEYIKSVFRLRKFLKRNKYDVYHCHHVLSALVAIFTFKISKNRLVVSFQNDPTNELGLRLYYFVKKFSTVRIFKNISSLLVNDEGACYLPNGVNMDFFKPINREEACSKLQLDPNKRYILFVSSNFIRQQKRLDRYRDVIEVLRTKYGHADVQELILTNTDRELVPYCFNASHVHLLTSDFEGSPNSVKEAMACNLPVVSTNVGNVSELLKGVDGCFVAYSYEVEELAKLVNKALKYVETSSRNRLFELNLDINSVALKILNLYDHLK